MANRKTKKEKQKTTQRRQQLSYSLQSSQNISQVSEATDKVRLSKQYNSELYYQYDVSLIIRDLWKTVFISLLIIASMLAAYFYGFM